MNLSTLLCKAASALSPKVCQKLMTIPELSSVVDFEQPARADNANGINTNEIFFILFSFQKRINYISLRVLLIANANFSLRYSSSTVLPSVASLRMLTIKELTSVRAVEEPLNGGVVKTLWTVVEL